MVVIEPFLWIKSIWFGKELVDMEETMKKCVFGWQVPVNEGEPYSPIMYAVHIGKAKKYVKALNNFFESNQWEWRCALDTSSCTLDEIFVSENQLVIFAPEGKTRQWLYSERIAKETAEKYYLSYEEYYSKDINGIINVITSLEI